MRAVIYARVSGAGQRDRHTIASQLRVLPEFVAARGWTLAQPVGHYVDDGHTAKAGHLEARESFARLLADATRGIFDVVAIVDVDRLTRSEDIKERGEVLGAFQRAGVKIAVQSTGQILDLGTSMGDLLSGLQAFFAAEENRKRRERTVQGKLTAIGRGRKPSGATLYGYDYDRAAGAWTVNETEAAIVRELFERVIGGASCYSLAAEMDARGVKRRRAGRWGRERVWDILRNPAYRGEWLADKRRGLRVTIPAIVSEAQWDDARAALERRATNREPKSRYGSLCEGIAFCGVCGSRAGLSGNSRGARYYACRDKTKPGRGVSRCPNHMIRVDVLDARVWAAICGIIQNPEQLADAVASRSGGSREAARDWSQEVAAHERLLAKMDRDDAYLLEMFRDDKIPRAVFEADLKRSAKKRAMVERQRDDAKRQAERAERERVEFDGLTATLSTLSKALDSATAEERRAIVRIMVPGDDRGRVMVYPERVEISGTIAPAALRLAPCGGCSCTVAAQDAEAVPFLVAA